MTFWEKQIESPPSDIFPLFEGSRRKAIDFFEGTAKIIGVFKPTKMRHFFHAILPTSQQLCAFAHAQVS